VLNGEEKKKIKQQPNNVYTELPKKNVRTQELLILTSGTRNQSKNWIL
jgi:hypothetical protein